ncbi:hypothetical protein [Desulfogranum japonicum]|uniref:hypothetical protein n=1 Tax=Desulfogranum japonicum TaxID=231447 RepID=UPI001294797A|nr:hypothetical protein [Desulfogranum japonicum]
MFFQRKTLLAAAIFLIFITTGCSKRHYFIIQSDSIALYYQNPDAREVLFASSIDHFTLHPAAHIDHGMWRITVPKRSNFSYFYLIDKVPEIPACELTVVDDFGARNCLFAPER